MDYGKIFGRAFEVVRKYRALWLFGVLLALFGGSGGGGSFNGGNFGNTSTRSGRSGTDFGFPQMSPETQQILVTIILALVCFLVIWLILSVILRFVSRAALVGLVQELEVDGVAPKVGRGFSIGANRFWQLLGIALTINIPLGLVSFVCILTAALPLIMSLIPLIQAGRQPPNELIGVALSGMFGSIALICCVALILWIVGIVITPFYEMIMRVCVVNKRGVFDSIREGYRLVRANLGNVAVLYVLIIGLGIAFGILMFIVALIIAAVVVGGVFLMLAMNSNTAAIILGLVLGIPILLLMLFVSGLFHAYTSTVWTEGYLALTVKPAQPIVPVVPIESAPVPSA